MSATTTPRGATVVTMYASPQCPLCQATDGTEPAVFTFPPTGADDPHTLVVLFMGCAPCDTKSRQADAAELTAITKKLSRYFDNWLLTEKVPRLIAQSNGSRAQA
jgi:hypothetical protein